METVLNKLPQELQRSLQRWYLVSCSAFIFTLLALAAVHIVTTISLNHAAATVPTQLPQLPQETAFTAERDVVQQRLDELELLIQKKQVVLPLLVTCINALPDEVRLTQLAITAQKTFTCSGETTHTHALTEFVNGLDAQGLSCTNVTINPTPVTQEDEAYEAVPITFHLEAQY